MKQSSTTERKDTSRTRGKHRTFRTKTLPGNARPILPPIPRGRLVMGRNCIREILRHTPDRVVKVFGAELDSKAARILTEEIDAARITLERVERDVLSEIVGTDSHQGFVAVLRERHFDGVRSFIERSEKEDSALCVILDSIVDPQNLGTLLRVSECFGSDAVIWSKNRGVDLTPTVAKASVGASEITNIIRISNLADTIRKLKEGGFWIAAFADEEDAHDLTTFEFPSKCAIVVGSEEHGVQRLIRELSDYKVRIPTTGRIRSLNVSQAAAVALSTYRMQMERKKIS